MPQERFVFRIPYQLTTNQFPANTWQPAMPEPHFDAMDFTSIRRTLTRILENSNDRLDLALVEFATLLQQPTDLHSSEDSDRFECYILLCKLFKTPSHRQATRSCAVSLFKATGPQHSVYHELIVHFFTPLLWPPLFGGDLGLPEIRDLLSLVSSSDTAAAVVASYSTAFFFRQAARHMIVSDIGRLNTSLSENPIVLNDTILDEKLALWT